MSETPRRCPECDTVLLTITGSEHITSCPNCGKFFESYRPETASRWPSLWKMALALCGPMLLMTGIYIGSWIALGRGAKELASLLLEIYSFGAPFVWFGWPLIGASLLAHRYTSGADRWMAGLGLTVAGIIGNTTIVTAAMLAAMLMR